MTNFQNVYVSLVAIGYLGGIVALFVWLKKRRQEREKYSPRTDRAFHKSLSTGNRSAEVFRTCPRVLLHRYRRRL